MNIWEQALREKINLCCLSENCSCSVKHKHLKHKISEHVVDSSWDFLAFPSEFCFFCLQLYMSCMWHYHTEISNPSTHITSEAAQAPSGFLWCFLRFSHRDSPSQIKVFDIPYGLSLSKRHVFINQYFVCFPSNTCTVSIFNLRPYWEKRTISQ